MSKNFEKGRNFESHHSPEISPLEIAEIISSDKYLKSLREAWTHSLKSDTEVGFSIATEIKTGKKKIGKITGSGEDAGISEVAEKSIGENVWRNFYQVINLHTHPNGSIYPSSDDFVNLMHARQMGPAQEKDDYYPIEQIIAAPEGMKTNQIDVLLLQEKRKDTFRDANHGHMMSDWLENSLPAEKLDDHGEGAKTINESPFCKAELLSYSRDEQTGVLIPLFTPEQLHEALERLRLS